MIGLLEDIAVSVLQWFGLMFPVALFYWYGVALAYQIMPLHRSPVMRAAGSFELQIVVTHFSVN